jgi:predicted NAD/FAD-dependent oxidoreductase
MSPSWSEQNWSETPNDIAFKAFERVKAILEVPQYSFHNIQKWKYALPSEKV